MCQNSFPLIHVMVDNTVILCKRAEVVSIGPSLYHTHKIHVLTDVQEKVGFVGVWNPLAMGTKKIRESKGVGFTCGVGHICVSRELFFISN